MKQRAEPVHTNLNKKSNFRQYFTEAAIRDNIFGLAASYLNNSENARASLSTKSTFDCNVSCDDARLNCVIMFGGNVEKWRKYVVTIGTTMMDQFMPWYFGVAFAFCFKYCTGMPDMPEFSKVSRHRRKEDAPRVELNLWSKIMTRRCEIALSKSWDLGFCISSLQFQSTLNMSRSVFAFETEKRENGETGFAPEELEQAAHEICNALCGSFKDARGRKQQVNGDMSKLRHMKLSQAARRIMDRVSAMAQKIPGTNEVRTIMRFDTHAARIAQGVPLFITWSPDEKNKT